MASPSAPLRSRLGAVRILQPLAHRDFALLTFAAAVSLLGDGFFTVALAWQVYEISNLPTALSLVGAAWTLPVVIFILLGKNGWSVQIVGRYHDTLHRDGGTGTWRFHRRVAVFETGE